MAEEGVPITRTRRDVEYEAPLQKAEYEAPLQKPPIRIHDSPFDRCAAVYSIDVSGSTKGPVLWAEGEAIRAITGLLPEETRDRCLITPWDTYAQGIVSLRGLDSLKSSGGTNPNILLDTPEYLDRIRAADVWFLLTDGEIDEARVQEFSRKLGHYGLHGKACVIIVFGYRPSRPTSCNISVGVSLYGVVPDCIFLFHDIETRELFVFQSKGCFDSMNNNKSLNAALENSTSWRDLATTNYANFLGVQVPATQSLGENEIILQDRRRIDLSQLYRGQLKKEEADAIIDNEDNLNAVMLTASTRGKRKEVEEWIQQQRRGRSEVSETKRPDVNGEATSSVIQIITLLTAGNLEGAQLHQLRMKLCQAHRRNWLALAQNIQKKESSGDYRNVVVENAMERMSLIKRSGTSSPRVLSPSSPLQSRPDPEMSVPIYSPGYPNSSDSSTLYRPTPRFVSNASPNTRSLNWRERTLGVQELQSQTTFLKGYRLEKGENKPYYEQCHICGDLSSTFALLLKSSADQNTPDFSAPRSRSEIIFPLALACYPETDVISGFTCCETCAFYVVEYGWSPLNEHIVAALPVLPSLDSDVNRRTWLKTVDTVLQERFKEDDLLEIMMAVLTNALDRYSASQSRENIVLCHMIRHVCDQVICQCRVSYAAGTLRNDISTAFIYWLGQDLCDDQGILLNSTWELLDHPVESFTLLLRNAGPQDSNLELRVLFLRLVLHILEEITANEEEGFDNPTLKSLTLLEEHATVMRNAIQVNYDIQYLQTHGLIEEMALVAFQSVKTPWERLSNCCMSAVHVCLRKMAKETFEGRTASSILSDWQDDLTFRSLCRFPWDSSVAAYYLATIESNAVVLEDVGGAMMLDER